MSEHAAGSSGTITSAAWWKAASIRALRTAITVALPYLGGAALFGSVPWLSILSAAALGYVLSLVTSLAGISETSSQETPVWLALLERTTKTLAQAIAAGIGNVLLFQDVPWSTVVQAAVLAGLGSLLLGVLGFLPESSESLPGAPVDVTQAAAPVFNFSVVAPNRPSAPGDPEQPAAGVPPSV